LTFPYSINSTTKDKIPSKAKNKRQTIKKIKNHQKIWKIKMKQKDRAKKLSGAEGFESYYTGLFGERWQKIKSAFSKSPDYLEWNAGGAESYFLDSASVRAAVSLPLSGAKKILDMCAAPGGKTLVLASNMDEDAVLYSNERSPERKRRLDRTIQTCLPEEISSRLKTSCKDGAKLCLESQNVFDRILLDAPCSSERHVLADQKYLSEWSPSRIKTLSVSQWALLSSAWRILVPGGFMVYSTCALSPDENDKVISKLLKKFDDVEILEPEISLEYKKFISADFSEDEFSKAKLPEYEKTEFGAHILPDSKKYSDSSIKSENDVELGLGTASGPLYFCLLHKKEI